MSKEKWIIKPGESRVIDLDDIRRLKVGLVGGQVDVVAHDDPGVRIEVHSVSVKELRIEADGDSVEIDHAQLRWDNFLEAFRNFGSGGPKADVSIAVPHGIDLNLGVVSASALVSGIRRGAKLNTVSGDLMVNGIVGDVSLNAVSGDVQVRDLEGALTANSVSGAVAVTGALRKATIDTVSGGITVDCVGDVQSLNVNTVSGDATIRLDELLAANYVARSVSGKVVIDGVDRKGSGAIGTTNYSGSTGQLAGTFVDVRANSVSGDLTVLRRAVRDEFDAPEATVTPSEPVAHDPLAEHGHEGEQA